MTGNRQTLFTNTTTDLNKERRTFSFILQKNCQNVNICSFAYYAYSIYHRCLMKNTHLQNSFVDTFITNALMTCGYLWSSRLIFMSHQTYLQAILHFHLAHYTNNEWMDEWAKSPEVKCGLSRWFCLKLRVKITIRDFPEQSLTDVCMPISEYRLPMNDPNFNIKSEPKALLRVMCKV